jgi:hypothetical protein
MIPKHPQPLLTIVKNHRLVNSMLGIFHSRDGCNGLKARKTAPARRAKGGLGQNLTRICNTGCNRIVVMAAQ